jgi:hypothetical protein
MLAVARSWPLSIYTNWSALAEAFLLSRVVSYSNREANSSKNGCMYFEMRRAYVRAMAYIILTHQYARNPPPRYSIGPLNSLKSRRGAFYGSL